MIARKSPESPIRKRPPLSAHLKKILLGWRPERRPGERERAFAALYAAGPYHAVSKRIGDNRGCWPIRFGVVSGWKDGITAMLEFGAPLYWQGMLFRVWCSSDTNARLLESLIHADLADRFGPLRKQWVDFGPELNVRELERAIRMIAADHGIRTWSDQEMVKHLEAIAEKPKDAVRRLRKKAATF